MLKHALKELLLSLVLGKIKIKYHAMKTYWHEWTYSSTHSYPRY